MAGFSWRLAAASAVGTAHVDTGLPCQDALAQRVLRPKNSGPVFLCAVCDGAGSAAYSDEGAKVASSTFVDLAERHFLAGGHIDEINRALAKRWVSETADSVRALAKSRQHAPREYASTLLGAIVGTNAAVFVQIGDGAIVTSHGPDDGWSWVFWPAHGEYANQTVFVVSENAPQVMEFVYAPRRIDAVGIFSDGIERMVLHTKTKAVNDDFFNHMLAPVISSPGTGIDEKLSAALAAYLASPSVNQRTSDDKTLVLATRRPRHHQ